MLSLSLGATAGCDSAGGGTAPSSGGGGPMPMPMPGSGMMSPASSSGGGDGGGAPTGRVLRATPADYARLLPTLRAGDTLTLAAGDYLSGMTFDGVNGAPGRPITVEGPASGAPARFLASSDRNTVDISNSSYLVLRNLLFEGNNLPVDAIKAGAAPGTDGSSSWSHHVTIEDCAIQNHDGGSQQTVGINSKIVSWDWIIRHNRIQHVGTGLYLGNSDGSAAFIGGLIEGNLVEDPIGYDMEIKYQVDRQQSRVPTVPTDPRVTIIRRNVWLKSDRSSAADGVRPNVLVDGFPDSGPGSQDHYEIYGNLFVHNPSESLLQLSGRVHLHDNIFVDAGVAAVQMQNHDGKVVQEMLVYHNTVYSAGRGISLAVTPAGQVWVDGNALFASEPIHSATDGGHNVVGAATDAARYVHRPSVTLGQMDFYPLAGSALRGAAVTLPPGASVDVDRELDFNRAAKDMTFRGAYSGAGANPGWSLAADFEPTGS